MNVWFDYYVARGGALDSISFQRIFPTILSQEPIINGKTGPKQVTYEFAVRNLIQYYDNKFL